MTIGKKRWAIPRGYISEGPRADVEALSDDIITILNASLVDAQVRLTLYFTASEPWGPYALVVPSERITYFRLGELETPVPVPRGSIFAAVFDSNTAIVVQHSGSGAGRQLVTTMPYSE